MNIFATSSCPKESAQYLDDKRVIKMCLETAQMLCTVLNVRGVSTPYKTTHTNHPCTKWVAAKQENFNWTVDHFISLCDEYKRRFEKDHACSKLLTLFQSHTTSNIKDVEFVNCTTYPDLPVHTAYMMLLSDKWEMDKRQPTWR